LLLKARGLKAEELVRLFERPPGAALSPPENLVDPLEFSEEAAAHLLGERVTCGSCSYSASLRYGLIAQAAKVAGLSLLNMTQAKLALTLRQWT
jgi:hypothetical protein